MIPPKQETIYQGVKYADYWAKTTTGHDSPDTVIITNVTKSTVYENLILSMYFLLFLKPHHDQFSCQTHFYEKTKF